MSAVVAPHIRRATPDDTDIVVRILIAAKEGSFPDTVDEHDRDVTFWTRRWRGYLKHGSGARQSRGDGWVFLAEVEGQPISPASGWAGRMGRWLLNCEESGPAAGAPDRYPMTKPHTNEWRSAEHAAGYLVRADSVPHRPAGEAVLLEELPAAVTRVLDLGCGDGRLLDVVLQARPGAAGVALDFSPHMLDLARKRFAGSSLVEVVAHDLDEPLPSLGTFQAVVSSFAIHHLVHERKRQLYEEVWRALDGGGVFYNLEHVASASAYGHARFLEAMGTAPEDEDPSNKLLDVETQLQWLRDLGFVDVDCYWKWRELALLVGRKPGAAPGA